MRIDEVLLAGLIERERQDPDGRFKPGNWGGIVAKTSDFKFSPAEPANMVYAEWTVPTVEPDFKDASSNTVGFWVGLDGFGMKHVLQAGSAATVTGEKIDNWAWFEWYPAPPVRIDNFPISAGDLITVLVCAPNNKRGFASMLNRTTGATFNVGFDPPPGILSEGMMAEWAVEGVSETLPNWVLMAFHECSAGTKNHVIDLSHPTNTEITGSAGKLTLSLVWQPNRVLVLWQGPA